MNTAYVRVSTDAQNEDRQMIAMQRYKIDKWFVEKVSASTLERPRLQAMIEFARSGDTVLVTDFSRLARNTADLLQLINTLREKDVHVISISENFDTTEVMKSKSVPICGFDGALEGFAQCTSTWLGFNKLKEKCDTKPLLR